MSVTIKIFIKKVKLPFDLASACILKERNEADNTGVTVLRQYVQSKAVLFPDCSLTSGYQQ
jgi:hypothetical protein